MVNRESRKVINIVVASVGGQGGHTLSRVIATAAVLEGYSVRVGESLGMSQRFGSVLSFIRLGYGVYSPTFNLGEADYLLGLEIIETLRYVKYLSSEGLALVSPEFRPPYMTRSERRKVTMSKIMNVLKQRLQDRLIIINAREIAAKVGNPKAANMVLLGAFVALSKALSIESVSKSIKSNIRGEAAELSIKALIEGYNLMRRTA